MPATLAGVAFWGGNMIPLDSLLPPLLRNSQIAQYIQATGKLGVLNLIIVHELVPSHFRLKQDPLNDSKAGSSLGSSVLTCG